MRTIPRPLLEKGPDVEKIVEDALAAEFGGMTSRKTVTADAGLVPDWKIHVALRNFLRGQSDIQKREKERTTLRRRDLDQEKFRRIVDGRTG